MSESNACMRSFKVAGVTVNIGSLRQAVAVALADARDHRGFCLFTLNLDHCAKLRRQGEFQEAYRRARYVTADGFPIVLLSRLRGLSVMRTTGADMLMPMCTRAARLRLPVFLIGPSTNVLRRAQARIAERASDLQVVGSYAPALNFDPQSADADVIIDRIRSSGARLCFIALGAPRQELFAVRCLAAMPDVGFVCVGAALDFLAGTQMRAPQFFRIHGLEWIWRLLSNPQRLAARYLQCAAVFPRLAIETITQTIFARTQRT